MYERSSSKSERRRRATVFYLFYSFNFINVLYKNLWFKYENVPFTRARDSSHTVDC